MEHILIVDDNRAFVTVIAESLRHRGYKVSVAGDGVEALRSIQTDRPDCLLLDIEIPHIDGLHLCQYLRSIPAYRDISIIFISVHSDLGDKLTAYEMGADDYVVKPFDMRELAARIQAVLRRASARREAVTESAPQATASLTDATQPVRAPVVRIVEAAGLRLNLDIAQIDTPTGSAHLTPAELDLLTYFMQHPDQLVSAERLLVEALRYPQGSGDPAVVRWHIKNLRRKIEPEPNKPVYLCTVSHYGYMLVSASNDVPRGAAL